MNTNGLSLEALARRLDRLESLEAIKKLKHQYCAYCDDNYDPEGIASLFIEDGVWDAGEAFGRHEGRAAIKAFFAGVSNQIIFAGHLVMNERIDIDGDKANGKWWVIVPMTMVVDGTETAHWILGEYNDDYVCVGGTGMFASLNATIHHVVPYKDGWAEA